MPDKTALGISEELRQFIEALVEEVVLEGKTFEEHMKYLQRFCQTEGVDYNQLETHLSDLFETAEELKTHESKASERLLLLLGKECYLTDDEIENIISSINKKRSEFEAKRQAEKDTKRRAEEEARRKREAEECAKAERRARENAERIARKKAFQQVKNIIVDNLDVDEADIKESTCFKDLPIDSLDQVELILAFERVFGFEVTEEMIGGISTVGDVIAKIVEKNKNMHIR